MKRKIFVLGILCIALFLFHFWMAFPGYIQNDTPASLWLNKDNWHPVIISYVLQFLYFLFGKHVYLFLLLQLVPLYLGLFFICVSFLIRFKSIFVYLILFPIFIGNIFFENFVLHSSNLSPMWIFLFYSLVFYQIMIPLRNRYCKWILRICIAFMLILALISRHNALFQVYPACFIWIYQFQKKKNLSFLKTCSLLVLSGLLTLNIAIHIPRLLSTPTQRYPAAHVYLHQIVGMCVHAQDETCIPKSWYGYGKNWNDTVLQYTNRSDADWTYVAWIKFPVFKGDIPISTLKSVWLQTLLKYPNYYFIHIEQKFLKKMLFSKLGHHDYSLKICRKEKGILAYDTRNNTFSYIDYTPIQTKIYKILDKYLPSVQTIYFVSFCAIVMFLSEILIILKKCSSLLMFTFSTSMGGVMASIFFILFTPNTYYRYMHPVLISALLALYGLIAYVWDKIAFLKEKSKT